MPTGSVPRERGFIMVALLIGMAVSAIWMATVLPKWRQQTQRQREEDLIFRGEQYARAIVLFQDKNQGANPPSIDVLVSQHFLRKKWKDPITNDEFVPVGPGIAVTQPGQPGGAGGSPSVAPTAPGQQGVRGGGGGGAPQALVPLQQAMPGITGVRSKSTQTSIKVYQNQQQYNLWPFDAAFIRQRMGRPMGNPQQGGRGGRGGADQPGGRGGIGGPGGRGGLQTDRPGRGGQGGRGDGRGGAVPPAGSRGRGGG